MVSMVLGEQLLQLFDLLGMNIRHSYLALKSEEILGLW
jgi:hypothetical protein